MKYEGYSLSLSARMDEQEQERRRRRRRTGGKFPQEGSKKKETFSPLLPWSGPPWLVREGRRNGVKKVCSRERRDRRGEKRGQPCRGRRAFKAPHTLQLSSLRLTACCCCK